jgi:diguanylate cyclase (GGDEF)-like protein/PAS domain S-box-containing protein
VGTDRILNAVYVLTDGVLLAAAAWLVLTPGPASASGRLLLAGAVTVFLADLAWSIADRFGRDWAVGLNPAYVVGYALVAAAALHPSAAALTRAVGAPAGRSHPARLVFLAASLFIGPLAVMLPARQPLLDTLVVSGCSLAIMAAVVGRFVALVRRTERQQEQLAANEARFRTMAESVPVGIYEVGADLHITWSNTQADELFGRRIDGVRAPELLRVVPPEDRPRIVEASERVLAGEAASAELRIRRADGTHRWVRWRGVPAPRSGTDPPAAPAVFASTEDVTDLKALQQELARLATHDPVTGLPNRRLLFEELTATLAMLADRRRSLAVMFCDLDRFKLVNDMLGHDAGDALLREIAGRLRTMLRTGDVVARFGGDEFVLLLRDPGSKLDIAALAQRIVERVQEPVIVGEHPVSVGASIGIALAHGPDDDPDALLRDADVAMYRAKSSGRGRYVFFGSGVHPAEG